MTRPPMTEPNWSALIAEIYGPGDLKRTGRPKQPAKLHKATCRPKEPAKLHKATCRPEVSITWRDEMERMRQEYGSSHCD